MQVMSDEYKPYIRFTDQSPSYCYGWEMGEIFAKLKLEKRYEGLIHTANLDQLELVCKRLGYRFEIKTVGIDYEDWRQVKVTPILRVLHTIIE
jgi:hypothetical protein